MTEDIDDLLMRQQEEAETKKEQFGVKTEEEPNAEKEDEEIGKTDEDKSQEELDLSLSEQDLEQHLGKEAKDTNSASKPKDSSDTKHKPNSVFPTNKYSQLGEGALHESIIMAGLPYFIKYESESNKITLVKKIDEPSRTLRPLNREEYNYIPYEFKDEEELKTYFGRAQKETIDSLYQKAKSIVRKYNDQDEYKLNLIAIDIIWSHFQDKFGTTHYIGIVGENDSGKSSIGNTFEVVGYRCINMTSPSAANIYRVLGIIEPGQCTLVLDEADRIDESVDMLNILKTGYDHNKKVSKINTNTWKQEYFWTYCLKIMIAEKSLNKLKAKGLLDRTLQTSVFPGDTEYDIKEVTNDQERASHLDRARAELLDFRKLMLMYRLIHFKDPIIDLDVGVKRRNKELCKPQIRLFYGTIVQKEVEDTFQIFLDLRNDKRSRSIEAMLIPIIIKLVEEEGNTITSSRIWDKIRSELTGECNGVDEFITSEHTLYRNTVSKILEDKFGGEIKHGNKGNSVTFYLDKLTRVEKSYDTDFKIKCTSKNVLEEESEGSEGNEGTVESAAYPEGLEMKKDPNISQDETPIDPLASFQEPSHPSHPSPYYKCYHSNCKFTTDDQEDYERHGALKHLENPLLYPSRYEIEKYGLTPQGKEWEV
jgi:hypothetical protein